MLSTLGIREPGMVRERAQAAAGERRREVVDLAAPDAIDDARLVAMAVDRGEHLLQAIRPGLHAIDEVRAIEVTDEHQRVRKAQLRDDVVTHGRRGRRGVRVHRHAGEALLEQ